MSSEDDESRVEVGAAVVLVLGSEDACSGPADLRSEDEKGRVVRRDDARG